MWGTGIAALFFDLVAALQQSPVREHHLRRTSDASFHRRASADAHAPSRHNAIRRQIEDNIAHVTGAGPDAINHRLVELEREWDIERALEVNAATISMIGLGLGAFVDRRFFIIPALVSGFLLQHALQGWCPPVTFFRRRGFRTSYEIDHERYALKALRGDFGEVPAMTGQDRAAAESWKPSRFVPPRWSLAMGVAVLLDHSSTASANAAIIGVSVFLYSPRWPMKLACLVSLVLTASVLAEKADLPDYRSQAHGVELPKAAEKLLLERFKAKQIVTLQSMVLERSGDLIYLGVYASYEIDWSFERVWHPSPYVLVKEATEKDWAKAKLYGLKNGKLREFFAKPEKDWMNELEEVKLAK